MHFKFIWLLTVAVFAPIFAEAVDQTKEEEANARLFLSTFTVILSTVTTTTTIPTTTTCTTSSTAMSACSAPAGRRRRGILYNEEEKDGRERRGLFYNDDEAEKSDGSISVPSDYVKRSATPTKGDSNNSVTIDDTKFIPLTIQSGFSLPEGFPTGSPRFKLAYGTSTVTATTTSTATRSLTIACVSITNYQVCSGAG